MYNNILVHHQITSGEHHTRGATRLSIPMGRRMAAPVFPYDVVLVRRGRNSGCAVGRHALGGATCASASTSWRATLLLDDMAFENNDIIKKNL